MDLYSGLWLTVRSSFIRMCSIYSYLHPYNLLFGNSAFFKHRVLKQTCKHNLTTEEYCFGEIIFFKAESCCLIGHQHKSTQKCTDGCSSTDYPSVSTFLFGYSIKAHHLKWSEKQTNSAHKMPLNHSYPRMPQLPMEPGCNQYTTTKLEKKNGIK